jgi:hypothetical protein
MKTKYKYSAWHMGLQETLWITCTERSDKGVALLISKKYSEYYGRFIYVDSNIIEKGPAVVDNTKYYKTKDPEDFNCIEDCVSCPIRNWCHQE